jgi:hypothetical protein
VVRVKVTRVCTAETGDVDVVRGTARTGPAHRWHCSAEVVVTGHAGESPAASGEHADLGVEGAIGAEVSGHGSVPTGNGVPYTTRGAEVGHAEARLTSRIVLLSTVVPLVWLLQPTAIAFAQASLAGGGGPLLTQMLKFAAVREAQDADGVSDILRSGRSPSHRFPWCCCRRAVIRRRHHKRAQALTVPVTLFTRTFAEDAPATKL